MKILISYDDRVRPDSTAVYFKKAFESLGHDVTHVYPEQIHEVSGGLDFYVKVDDGLSTSTWNPKLHPAHYYCIDTHIEWDWRVKMGESFDSVSVTQKPYLSLPWTCKNVEWNPPGCDTDYHNVGKQPNKYDVAFIGNFHSQFAIKRIDMVHSLFEAFPNFFYGARTFQEMATKFAESKIVFNQSLNGDINMRFFEAMCSGSCLVTDRIPEIKDLGFEDGKHYVGYSTKEEMIRVVKGLLEHDQLRESIAEAGHRKVLKHTYEARAKAIIEQAFGKKKPTQTNEKEKVCPLR